MLATVVKNLCCPKPFLGAIGDRVTTKSHPCTLAHMSDIMFTWLVDVAILGLIWFSLQIKQADKF